MPNHYTCHAAKRRLLSIAQTNIAQLSLSGLTQIVSQIVFPTAWLVACRKATYMALAFASLLSNSTTALAEPHVLLETSMGDIEIDLHADVAPGHVQNFLNYVNDGDYDLSFIHRSINNFIIQGGGFTYIDSTLASVPTDTPIANEFAMSNLRGTIAMAKFGSDPNSATSQWFINLADNSANLDTQNGGFTVFATVVQGMDIVDAIAALPLYDLDPPPNTLFDNVPMRNTPLGDPVVFENHLVFIESASQTSHFEIPILPQPLLWLLAATLGLAAGGSYHQRAARTRSK